MSSQLPAQQQPLQYCHSHLMDCHTKPGKSFWTAQVRGSKQVASFSRKAHCIYAIGSHRSLFVPLFKHMHSDCTAQVLHAEPAKHALGIRLETASLMRFLSELSVCAGCVGRGAGAEGETRGAWPLPADSAPQHESSRVGSCHERARGSCAEGDLLTQCASLLFVPDGLSFVR